MRLFLFSKTAFRVRSTSRIAIAFSFTSFGISFFGKVGFPFFTARFPPKLGLSPNFSPRFTFSISRLAMNSGIPSGIFPALSCFSISERSVFFIFFSIAFFTKKGISFLGAIISLAFSISFRETPATCATSSGVTVFVPANI